MLVTPPAVFGAICSQLNLLWVGWPHVGRPPVPSWKNVMATVLTSSLQGPDGAAVQTNLRPMLGYDLLAEVEVAKHPFEYLPIPRFLTEDCLDAVHQDFPIINQGGSFPLSALRYGAAFKQLTDELLGDR